MSEEQATNRFEEKAREIVSAHVRRVNHAGNTYDNASDDLAPAIATALEEAYQEGIQSERSMNELVKIGQEKTRSHDN